MSDVCPCNCDDVEMILASKPAAPQGEELYLYLKGFDGFTLKADGWKRDMR